MATQIWTVTRKDHGIVGTYSDMERALDAIGIHGDVEPSRGRAVSGMEHWEYQDYAVDVTTLDAPISPEVEAGTTTEAPRTVHQARPAGEQAARRAQATAKRPAEHKAPARR